MGMAISGGGGAQAEPNVTPMIDVMLVVPAIQSGFQAVPPQGQNIKAHPEEDTDQVLGIDANGQYYLNKKPIRNETLPEQLKRIFDVRTLDKILYIKAHKELDYGKVLTAMDIAAHNGVRVTAMISDQRPGTQSTVEGDAISMGGTPGEKKGGTP